MSAERGACYPPSANDVRLLRLANGDGWREGCVYTSGRLGLVARQTRRTSGLAVAALVAQSIFLGFNWVVMKVGLRYAALWPFVALRTGLGAMALLLLLAILRRPFWP
ncbi:MAG: hypothetical protein H5T84_08485, partial [Thermoleophilia bacterium]|nr:hypothetical protein [Thermoleophilia bacterium]